MDRWTNLVHFPFPEWSNYLSVNAPSVLNTFDGEDNPRKLLQPNINKLVGGSSRTRNTPRNSLPEFAAGQKPESKESAARAWGLKVVHLSAKIFAI